MTNTRTVHLWLALDPETFRVTAHAREPDDSDFPRGLRGQGWARREADINADLWEHLLAGGLKPAEQDELHRRLWTENGETAWLSP